MPTLYNADLKPLRPGVPTHPYDHATKLFVADNFRLAPKQTFLYYVVINIDPAQASGPGGLIGDLVTLADRYQNLENGMLVKRVDLPKFNLDTKTLNAYNRKNIVQTSIRYDPVTVTFHDDAADVITNFWNDYYTYYFRDSDYNAESYRQNHKYNARNKIGWGYSPANGGLSSTQRPVASFIKDIRIYSLHNKRFTEYRLINPAITSWRHGEHDYSSSNGTMENTMTVAYETVKYYTGYVNPVDVSGFSLLHYDNFNSPISTSITNIYSESGVLGALTNGTKDLAKPQGTGGSGGPLSSILSMYRAYNNLKNINLQTVAGTVLGQVGSQILNNGINSAVGAIFPVYGSGPGGVGSSQVGAPGTAGQFGYSQSQYTSGITIGGSAASYLQGLGLNASNQFLSQVTAAINRGIQGFGTSQAPSLGSTQVYDALGTRSTIIVDPKTQQPVTGTITAIMTDDSGQVVSTLQTVGTQSGKYNPNNPLENLVSVQTVKDESNNYVSVTTYKDGTQITEDADGNRIAFVPGNYTNTNNINTNPMDARAKADAGYSTAGVQYYTDPKTGIVYTTGGTTAAQITNTLAGTAGSISGLYAGQYISSALTGVLGTSVVGRTLNAAISTATGAAVGRAINNGLQPIINQYSGQVVQGWNSITGSINNVLSSWSGTGGYIPTNPTTNIVTSQKFDDGSILYTYKDGTTRSIATDGQETVVPGSNNAGILNWFNGSPGQNSDSSAVTPNPGTIWTDSSGTPIFTGFGGYVYQGDTTFSPIAITEDQWNADAAANEAALQDWASTSGPNDSPYTPPSDLSDLDDWWGY